MSARGFVLEPLCVVKGSYDFLRKWLGEGEKHIEATCFVLAQVPDELGTALVHLQAHLAARARDEFADDVSKTMYDGPVSLKTVPRIERSATLKTNKRRGRIVIIIFLSHM